jgi:two-component system OmpR family response regulator
MALEGIYEALVLDRMLPAMDGVTLVRRLREHDPRTPVLMLSAVASTVDRVEGMRAGCDDYLVKPYMFAELLARLEALGRRADRSRRLSVLRVGDLELDTVGRTVSRAGQPIRLQRREFLLLEQLVRHAGQVVTRSMLLEATWNYDFEARGNIVDMHIHRLRIKVDEGFSYPLIQTVPSAGYTIREPDGTPTQPHQPA